jgi:hypothetical protein
MRQYVREDFCVPVRIYLPNDLTGLCAPFGNFEIEELVSPFLRLVWTTSNNRPGRSLLLLSFAAEFSYSVIRLRGGGVTGLRREVPSTEASRSGELDRDAVSPSATPDSFPLSHS